ncbi:hypothetical protein E5A73_05375 [Sphingomonas gei]|uniref:Uncharacterized protein n=1 Tax=Sphingomonas gei TaxID=1395960 RepID=A0A4S1XFV4_9SPHN|nr:hypothetical protein E5A73_05375 [Sphingomonas gei]
MTRKAEARLHCETLEHYKNIRKPAAGGRGDLPVQQACHRPSFLHDLRVAPFAEGKGPQGPMVEINLRCADGVDLEALEVRHYDGASR